MWTIYLISILDSISCVSMLLALLSIVAIIMTDVICIVDEDDAKTIKLRKLSIILLSIFAPIALFVPNSKQAAMIFAVGTTIEYVQNNKKIKELPDNAVLCLDKFMDEYLNEEKQ